MRFILILIIASSTCFHSCVDNEQRQHEIQEPLAFLNLTTIDPKGSPNVIRGFIFNHAEYITYENIQLLVTYYSARGHKIGTEHKAFYDAIPPRKKVAYSFNITPPPPPQDETSEITVIIIRASPSRN